MRVLNVFFKVTLLLVFFHMAIPQNAPALKREELPAVVPDPISSVQKSTIFLVTNQVCTCHIDGEKGEQLSPAIPEKRTLPLGSYLIKARTPDGRSWQKIIAIESPAVKIINILFESPLPANADKSLLTISSGTACTLIMDGETKGRISPDTPLQVDAGLGGHFLIALDKEGKIWNEYLDVTSPTPQNVTIWAEGQLYVETDLFCDFYLNDEKQGQVSPTAPLYVSLAPGEYLLKASSESGEIWAREIHLISSEQKVINIKMRFVVYQNGTVLDQKTGLMWAVSGNGYGITWDEANNYCTSCRIGGYSDWRMPSLNELIHLYHALNDAELIKISSSLWASESREFEACAFRFSKGIATWHAQEDARDINILPVRSASSPLEKYISEAELVTEQEGP